MNILIIAGGTGSIALQTGLFNLIDTNIDGVETKVLVNAYDNGLSTGMVRKVMDGKILGPSDVRKNQTTRLKLERPNSAWHAFLDIRFTVETEKAREFCLASIDKLEKSLVEADCGLPIANAAKLLREAVGVYFETPIASKIDYADFSLANIVYAGFAKANGHSLRAAARIMAQLMNIKDNVILNDDKSLFLGAVSRKGVTVTDEGDIVSWGKQDDPFESLFFYDNDGQLASPMLSQEAREAIVGADLIVLSSGTQWSSLIPTYETVGFADAVKASKARIVMVMNRQPDKDSPGQSASDIVNLLVPKYFPTKSIRLITDASSPELMKSVSDSARDKLAWVETVDMRCEWDARPTVHNPAPLAKAVLLSAYREFVGQKHFMFDYDDTLVGRSGKFGKASAFNRAALLALNRAMGQRGVSICTGNSIKAINLSNKSIAVVVGLHGYKLEILRTQPSTPLTVFADGGINRYEYDVTPTDMHDTDDGVHFTPVECIDETCKLVSQHLPSVDVLKAVLCQYGIPADKIENRGDVMLSIKPIDPQYRAPVLALTRLIVKDLGLIATATGRSTIDISKPHLTKAAAVEFMLNSGISNMTYVGDEMVVGNDAVVARLNNPHVKCFQTSGPAETALLLMATLQRYEQNL